MKILETFNNRKASHRGFNPHIDTYDNRKDAAFLDHLDTARKLYNAKSPKNPILRDARELGKGSYGTIVPATSNKVVKFDKSNRESQLHKKLPERLKTHSVIPKETKVGSIRVPPAWKSTYKPVHRRGKFSTISREDIPNLPSGHIANHLYNLNKDIEQIVDTDGHQIIPVKKRKPISAQFYRHALKSVISKWHKNAQNDFNLTNDEKKHLRTYVGGLARLIHHGIVPHDLTSKNIGLRKDGSLVMRDLGIYKVLDDSKPKQQNKFIASKIKNNVDKFKTLRKAQ